MPKEKLRAAFKKNLRFYAYATVIIVILAIIVAVSKGFWPSQVGSLANSMLRCSQTHCMFTQLAAYLIAVTNCYGMLLIVVMIGYGKSVHYPGCSEAVGV